MTTLCRHLLAQLVLLTAVMTAYAADSRSLPPEIERVIKWLPEDTETLTVAQSFELPLPQRQKDLVALGPQNLKPFIFSLAIGEELAALDESKYVQPLLNRKVALALSGGRNFEVVSAFGSLRSESCSIIVFADDLGDAGRKWIDMVRRAAKESREIAGQQVFVFPSTTAMEGIYKLKPWQGTYLAMPKPDTLLCASSDRYLTEVLTRMGTSPKRRALNDSLPEWKLVDPQLPAWMLRHIPGAIDNRLLAGLTWTWKDDQLELIYRPARQDTATKTKEAVTARWTQKEVDLPPRPGGAPIPKFPIVQPDRIAQRADDSIAVSFRTSNLSLDASFWFGMHLYVSRGEDGFLGVPNENRRR